MTARLKNPKEWSVDMIIDIEHKVITGVEDREYTSVEFDSRKVIPGSIFVAVKGFTSDGHVYIDKALESGASMIVADSNDCPFTDEELKAKGDKYGACIIKVNDSRKASALIAKQFFQDPESAMNMIGVTGTKGKTTITFMIADMLEHSGIKTGLIGTVYDIVDGEKKHAAHTTPEARDNYELLRKMADCDTKACIMEVSSQGLKLDRVCGIGFDIGCYTNFYEDHIGGNEHPDMEDYLNCKLKLMEMCDTAVINTDTPVSGRFLDRAREHCSKIYTYGMSDGCDIRAVDIVHGNRDGHAGTSFRLISPWYEGEVFVGIPGVFNVYNALCAIAVAFISGADKDSVLDSIAHIEVPGRLQPVKNDLNITILVDYAHNAASLENVLDTLRETTQGRVITVFGCGGDRSHTRRFEMGEVSGKKSDYTIVTSDNPRTEDPMVIIGHIVSSIEKTGGKFEIVADRAEAIRKAVLVAKPGDIVLIAGKGHEDYQIFKDRTIHFDDAEVAAEAVRKIQEDRS